MEWQFFLCFIFLWVLFLVTYSFPIFSPSGGVYGRAGRNDANSGPAQLLERMLVYGSSPAHALNVRPKPAHLVNWAGLTKVFISYMGFLAIIWTNYR